LLALEPKPATLIEAAQDAEPEIHILLHAAVQTRQPLGARIHPQRAAHGVEDARFNAMRRVVGIGTKSQTIAAALLAVIFVHKGVRQQRENPADAFLVFVVLSQVARPFAGRVQQLLQAFLLLLLRRRAQRAAVAQSQ